MLDYQWAILRTRVDKFRRSQPLAGHKLFVIQHVLDDLVQLVAAFVDLGCLPQDITVIGIPYSSRRNAGEALEARIVGCRVILPRIFPMDGIIAKLLLDDVANAGEQKKPIIVLEDGGYAVPMLSQMAHQGLISLQFVKGAVEQTTRGKWLDQRIDRDGYLAMPVISIPDCETKKVVEPPYIAQAVVRNLWALLNEVAPGRQIKAVGMYGHGTIGEQVASYFNQRGAQMYVADLTPARRYRVLAGQKYLLLDGAALPLCDLVLGTTGSTSVGPEVIALLKNDAMLASTSSRQIEIDMDYLNKDPVGTQVVDPRGSCVLAIPAGRRFTVAQPHSSKKVTVLYDGYPINFWGTSLPDHVSDAVLSLLLEGVLSIAQDSYQPGVHPGGTVLLDADVEITRMFKVIEAQLGFSSSASAAG